MSFGLDSYNYLLELIINSKKQTIYYTDFKKGIEGIINRHDIDFCPVKAHQIAKIEFKKNIRSTFFFLVKSPLYSVYKVDNIKLIKDIINMGHKIGLHFDPKKVGLNMDAINNECREQINILEKLLCIKVDIISFHRPEKRFIGMKDKLINKLHTYMPEFINQIPYCSDSGGVWKYDDPAILIKNKKIKSLQLLTHPIWWTTPENLSSGEKIAGHLENADPLLHEVAANNCLPYKIYLRNKGKLKDE